MIANFGFAPAILLASAIVAALPDTAFAISAEVAKKCTTLTEKMYPPRQVGNPAAGSASGNARAQREYFSKCVASGGDMGENSVKPAK